MKKKKGVNARAEFVSSHLFLVFFSSSSSSSCCTNGVYALHHDLFRLGIILRVIPAANH